MPSLARLYLCPVPADRRLLLSGNRVSGRAMLGSACENTGSCATIPNALHALAQGYCDTTNQAASINYAITDTYIEPWHYHWLNIVLSELREMGIGSSAAVSTELHKSLE